MAHKESLSNTYRRGIRTTLRNNTSAYGYSIVVTAGFASLARLSGSPTLGEVYLFIVGAVIAFASLEMIASRMFREQLRGEPSNVVALGTAFSVVSISAAVGVTSLAASSLEGWVGWLVSGFASTAAYLLVQAVEMALAERVQRRRERSQ